MTDKRLEIKVTELIQQQKQDWELAKTNYAGLEQVESRTFDFGGFRIDAQFNPERIRSSAAKTDTQSIQQRACFLCGANRPKEQTGLDFMGKYTILLNPYPIFPEHLTISLNEHLPQEIEPYLADMFELSQALPAFTIFYNGPRCGASAPDHFHFQAGSKQFIPAGSELKTRAEKSGERLFHDQTTSIYAIGKGFLRNVLVYTSSSPTALQQHIQTALDALKERGQEGEPMLNLLVNFENGQWQALLFPRDRQRPRQFFAEGDAQILMSPASVEMAGLVILPRKDNFDQLTKDDLTDIYRQVSINEEDFERLKNSLAGLYEMEKTTMPGGGMSLRKGQVQPEIQVGIMSGTEINFELKGNYTAGNQPAGSFFTATVDGDGIQLQSETGQLIRSNEFYFQSGSDADSFILKGVTIGIDFHWEQKQDQQFRGNLKLIAEKGKLWAINVAPLEEYLRSVISSEMSATSSPELLKAHAVISRSWLLAQIGKSKRLKSDKQNYQTTWQSENELIRWYDREDHSLFDVCADDHCQRYQGITKIISDKANAAIDATFGEVLFAGGHICDARFSKCCGGISENFEHVWEPVFHSYLTSITDSEQAVATGADLRLESEAEAWIRSSPPAFCNTSDQQALAQVLPDFDQKTTDFYRWKVTYTQDELSALIRKKTGIDFGRIIRLEPVERGYSARLIKLKITGTKRTMTIGKELEIRRALSESHLYSSAFVVDRLDEQQGIPQQFRLTGAGWGHGVGLCQIGAAVMGEKGYRYKSILNHYFRGASLIKQY
ncbi:DUF4922 domain-containing protein [Gaoshiqia sp. Z1-71]|uniref:DUF4922 domain-containing protein n=1 Tax=Gaoshiqia hydrogeniformans TaxID=3290090 RepID=UPI003BF8FAA2